MRTGFAFISLLFEESLARGKSQRRTRTQLDLSKFVLHQRQIKNENRSSLSGHTTTRELFPLTGTGQMVCCRKKLGVNSHLLA
jgi:hypothetical protein